MKGVQSGVQKLLKNEIPTVYDVGCTCHLANLIIKAGLEELPIDIDKLFVDINYYFYQAVSGTNSLMTMAIIVFV